MKEDKNKSKLIYMPTKVDMYWEGLATSMLATLICMTIYTYSDLPDQIPTHFNIKGEADGYGSKNMVWLIVVLSIALYFFLGWIKKFGNSFNYPVKVTPENRQAQYDLGIQLLIRMKAIIMVLMVILLWLMIDIQRVEAWGMIRLPILLIGVLFVYVIKYTVKSFKMGNNNEKGSYN